jgi:hypothetical protein
VIQRFEALFLVLQVLRGSDEFLHRFHVKELMNVVVVPEEIRGNFPRPFELAVFSNHSLDLFHESVFGVVAVYAGGSAVGVLKLLGSANWRIRRDCNGAVGAVWSKPTSEFVLEAGD